MILTAETLPVCFQFAILVQDTGAYRSEAVFAAFTVSQPSRDVPVCLPKCYSTETVLMCAVNDLLQAPNSGCVSILLVLDLSAAFYTTDHNILITRLRTTFDCSGMVLDCFSSYFSCRTQSMFVGHESTPSVLQCGVPQDSVLGPLLFTLYTHPVFVNLVFHIISLQMIPSFTNQVFLLTLQFLSVF